MKVQDLGDIRLGEDMMAAFDTFGEAEIHKESPQIVKADIGVRSALENPQKDRLAHFTIMQKGTPRTSVGRSVLTECFEMRGLFKAVFETAKNRVAEARKADY